MFYTLQSLGFLESCIYDKLCLLDWLVELKKIQIICFQKVLNVSYMEYFLYSSMFVNLR